MIINMVNFAKGEFRSFSIILSMFCTSFTNQEKLTLSFEQNCRLETHAWANRNRRTTCTTLEFILTDVILAV